jgi:hypothetical protein
MRSWSKPPRRPMRLMIAYVKSSAVSLVKSSAVSLIDGIPSYLSGSNPPLSNFWLAAASICDLNRSNFADD